MDLYTQNAIACARQTTLNYSTSFSLGIRLFATKYRNPVYAIYGFVRFADEIVDTFHEHDKLLLLNNFRKETYLAIEQKISLNPILHAFQWVVNTYNIDREFIDAFLHSMELDLTEKKYDAGGFQQYVYGSAEVVGLMCLRVFCHNRPEKFETLVPTARKLGEAFQKINFLRDLSADYDKLSRSYFPNVSPDNFNEMLKKEIERDIEHDFNQALLGIRQLDKGSKTGVYTAYSYYRALFDKIRKTPATELLKKRYRVSNIRKAAIALQCIIATRIGVV
jgi:phytoene/squalene synthetase